jgi:hypothetical protein
MRGAFFARDVLIACTWRRLMAQVVSAQRQFVPQRHDMFTSWNYLSLNADLL